MSKCRTEEDLNPENTDLEAHVNNQYIFIWNELALIPEWAWNDYTAIILNLRSTQGMKSTFCPQSRPGREGPELWDVICTLLPPGVGIKIQPQLHIRLPLKREMPVGIHHHHWSMGVKLSEWWPHLSNPKVKTEWLCGVNNWNIWNEDYFR